MKTVLVADDERDILEAFQIVFSPHADEIRLLTAADGREAVELLSAEPVDLLVTDLNMPVLNGFQVLAHLTRSHKSIPVIVTTGFGSPQTARQLDSFGPLTYIEKPFQLGEVVERVRLALGQSARGRIEGITLASFLQLLRLERKTCLIGVRSHAREAVLDFVAGELVDAECGELRGESAAIETLEWGEIEIRIEPAVRSHVCTVHRSLEGILLEAARLCDERKPLPARANAEDDVARPDLLLTPAEIELALARVLLDRSPSTPTTVVILETLARTLGWQFATYWTAAAGGDDLEREAFWLSPSLARAEAERGDRPLVPNLSLLARRVYESSDAVWYSEIARDPELDRQSRASGYGFRSALAFNISEADSSPGVIELWSDLPRKADAKLLAWLVEFAPRLANLLSRGRERRPPVEPAGRDQAAVSELEARQTH